MVRGESTRPITMESEVETEWEGAETDGKQECEIATAAKPIVNVVGEYLAVLSEVCEGLCGKRFSHELGVVVLFEHGGMRAPSAAAFLGEQRMWDWIRNYEFAIGELPDLNMLSRKLDPDFRCVCGAKNISVSARRYCAAMSQYGRATMTKKLACHWPHRLSNVGSRWVSEGPWKTEDLTQKRWINKCAMAELWMGLWINTSESVSYLGMRHLYLMGRAIRFREGVLEREFLYHANREQIREAIANANGTEVVRIEGEDYTSRAEWVRVFYNSLRSRPLQAWPHVDPCV